MKTVTFKKDKHGMRLENVPAFVVESASITDKAKDPVSELTEAIDKIRLLGGYNPSIIIKHDSCIWNGIQIEIDSYLSKPPKYRVFASNPELRHLFPQREMTWDEWLNQCESPQAKSKINDESLPT